MPVVSINELAYQEVGDTAPTEDRLFETPNSQGENLFFLKAKGEYIPLPKMKSNSVNDTVEPYLKLATKIDNTLNNFYRIVGKANAHVRTDGMNSNYEEGMLELCYINTAHYKTARNHGRQKFQDKAWVNSESYSVMGKIRYYQDGSVKVHTQDEITEITYCLFGADEAFTVKNHHDFDLLIGKTEDAIKDLFIQQGFEPSEQRRQNLISLVFGVSKSLLNTKEIQKLLGTNFRTHTIDNPNLIRLAAHGCNESMMKLFYTNELYPDSAETMIELASMPFDMLYGIWAGKVKG
jgi:hypothetical protein